MWLLNLLKKIWNLRVISNRTKLRIFNSNVKSVLLCVSETWRKTKSSVAKSCNHKFVNKCLRRILKIKLSWTDRITNEDLWKQASQDAIQIQIRCRKWRWIGHTLRKHPDSITRKALKWNLQGKRKRGRPENT